MIKTVEHQLTEIFGRYKTLKAGFINFATKSPQRGLIWKSNKYRKWIRENCRCFMCGVYLLNEKEGFVTHHHHHAGGKHPRDQLLVNLCLKDHNLLHANEEMVSTTNFDDMAVVNLGNYLRSLNIDPEWVKINALGAVAQLEE